MFWVGIAVSMGIIVALSVVGGMIVSQRKTIRRKN